MAVPDTVVSFEVCRGFGGREQVVGRHCVFGMGQGYVHHLGAFGGQVLHRFEGKPLYFRIDALGEVFLRQADLQPLDAIGKPGGEIRDSLVQGCRVTVVMSGNHIQQQARHRQPSW